MPKAPRILRPQPPEVMLDDLRTPALFRPAYDVLDWIVDTFVADDGPLFNPDHAHLAWARIGVVWTNVPNRRQMREVAATAEMPNAQGSVWVKARAEFQLSQWFGEVPQFLLTFDALHAIVAPDLAWCARVEHELYHCAQLMDEYDQPKFTRDGEPKFGIRGHDAEEFVGVVARYGVGAAAGGVAELVRAAQRRPSIGEAQAQLACGTCGGSL